MRAILLDPEAEVSALISDIPSVVGVKDLRSKLAFFDAVFHVKEGIPASRGIKIGGPGESGFFETPERERRLNLFGDEPVQNYLASRRAIFTQKFTGSITLADAIENSVEDFSRGISDIPSIQIVLPDRLAEKMPVKRPCFTLNALDGFSSPPEDTPIEEIFFFKERRKAELDAFWAAVEQMADDIAFVRDNNPGSNLRGQLLTALRDYEKVANERWTGRISNRAVFVIAIGSAMAELAKPGFEFYDSAVGLGSIAMSVMMMNGPTYSSPYAHAMSYAAKLKKLD